MNTLRIGLAQAKQTGCLDANAEAIFRLLEEASKREVQVVCFPEAQTVGYRIDIAQADTPVPVGELAELHDRVARRCGELGMACILGTETPLDADPEGGKPYNSALVISEKGDVLGAHHKTRLTPLDAVAYTPGQAIETFELFGITVGVVICFEALRFAHTTEECVRQGAQVVFHPQNNTTRSNDWKIPIHHAMVVTRAAENTIWFATCNACLNPYQNCQTMVVAPNGQIHEQVPMKKETLLVSDIDVDRGTRAMFRYDMADSAELLFGDTVGRDEYASILRNDADRGARPTKPDSGCGIGNDT